MVLPQAQEGAARDEGRRPGRGEVRGGCPPVVQSFRATLLANARAALLARFAQGDEADIERSAGLAAQAIRTTTLLAAIVTAGDSSPTTPRIAMPTDDNATSRPRWDDFAPDEDRLD